MPRTADYTIQGFLYQFNKTLLEILNSPDDAVVTVEGIIEDIEIVTPEALIAIQCKYHETSNGFTLSAIYEPLLQMMLHFHQNPDPKITYVLFAHFPGYDGTSIPIDKTKLEQVLASTNKKFKNYVDILKGTINLDAFLLRFSTCVGVSYDTLVTDVCHSLRANDISGDDIETLGYPNAIQMIANLSIKHNEEERRISKKELLSSLHHIKKTAISQWTLASKTRKQLLEAKRKQLKPNLDKNSRLRYFIVYADTLGDFDAQIVLFVSDYCDKYHFKHAHMYTPLLCLVTTEETFRGIQYRLHKKGITANDGYIGDQFDEARFFRKPMIEMTGPGSIQREFMVRILRWESHNQILNHQPADDVFIFGSGNYSEIATEDLNIEELASESLTEIKFMMGISNVYE